MVHDGVQVPEAFGDIAVLEGPLALAQAPEIEPDDAEPKVIAAGRKGEVFVAVLERGQAVASDDADAFMLLSSVKDTYEPFAIDIDLEPLGIHVIILRPWNPWKV
jgi:hypothetical protein